MSKDKIIKRLLEQSINDDNWLNEAKERQENEGWLTMSAAIALRILTYLRENKITQKELAAQLGYSPQYVNKIVKGSENLTLETIVKIENTLGFKLIKVMSTDAVSDHKTAVARLEEASFV
jgi:ribosome-binding protein aMBF1 (putative translation factor)